MDGKAVAAKWYSGAVEGPAPSLDIAWPSDFCGAVDFGSLTSGEIALVEANPPYACGWYGTLDEYRVYAEWIVAGWKYLHSHSTRRMPVTVPVLLPVVVWGAVTAETLPGQ